jgi:hypothetical protein
MLLQSCEQEEKAELSLRKLGEGVADVSSAGGGRMPSQCGLVVPSLQWPRDTISMPPPVPPHQSPPLINSCRCQKTSCTSVSASCEDGWPRNRIVQASSLRYSPNYAFACRTVCHSGGPENLKSSRICDVSLPNLLEFDLLAYACQAFLHFASSFAHLPLRF